MFIPSIDAMWCECLTFFYKIGFSSFSTRSIVRGLKFERNEFHVFNRVIRQVEMCRYCCCSVSVTRVICGLSVFGESFTKCTLCLPYVLPSISDILSCTLSLWICNLYVAWFPVPLPCCWMCTLFYHLLCGGRWDIRVWSCSGKCHVVGWLQGLLDFWVFARTNRSRRFGERR